jgi:hypothetical protein
MPAAVHPAPRASRPSAPRGGLRPFARVTARHRRLGRRLAAGLTPAQVARAEGVPEAEIAALLAETDLAELADDYRALSELPEAEARKRLLTLARQLLEEAVVSGDARIAFFVLREERRGRDPARRLVDGLLAAQRRAARLLPDEPPPAPPAAGDDAPSTPPVRRSRRPDGPPRRGGASGGARGRARGPASRGRGPGAGPGERPREKPHGRRDRPGPPPQPPPAPPARRPSADGPGPTGTAPRERAAPALARA